MGQSRIATCPQCGELFAIVDGFAITTNDGLALLMCSCNCLFEVWDRDGRNKPSDKSIYSTDIDMCEEPWDEE